MSLLHIHSPKKNLVPNTMDSESSTLLRNSTVFPSQFMWPQEDLASSESQDPLLDPPVDLKGFFNGDQEATDIAVRQIRDACSKHGFFQVINHGVDARLVQDAHEEMDVFFKLPLSKKMAMKRKQGGICGYSGAHADRFSSKLPWKETFSFIYKHQNKPGRDVMEYIKSVLGNRFEEMGFVYQQYCDSMMTLALAILELLAISLGVERFYYRNFFEDGTSLVRANNYPPCSTAALTFGTGPHSDPNSLTILHQDQVGGLEIFSDGKWRSIRPRSDAFAVNIGDTFMALTNGRYKSCIHRALVNEHRARRSIVFFMNPEDDRVVSPHHDLLEVRKYPDFTWALLKTFTQNHYRADTDTLQRFVQWLGSNTKDTNLNVGAL